MKTHIPSRRQAMLALLLAATGTPSLAQTWPARPIRMIVPFPAGAGPDTIARRIGDSVSKRLGQPVVVENRPGASANLGADAVAKAAPDGYTILYGFNQIATMNPHLFTKLSYNAQRDLQPVTQLNSGPYVLLASPRLAASSLRELIDVARKAPGTINYGSYGAGTASHLGMLLVEQAAGISMLHVPYRQGVINDVVANVVSLTLEPAMSAIPWVQDGRLKALAVSGPRRVASLPDTPTLGEILPGVELTGWQGVWVPAGTPRSIVMKLNEVFNASAHEPELASLLRFQGVEVMGTSPEQMAEVIRAESEKWGELIRTKRLQLD